MNDIIASASRQQRRALKAANRSESYFLRQVPSSEWPPHMMLARNPPREVWRSKHFLVQIFEESGHERLTVCRTELSGQNWRDGISWDDLQNLKRECGRGHRCAVELFPPDSAVVNVANMRHLWIVDSPDFMWGKS